MDISAFFPGQGAQKPGMGQSVFEASAAAREVFSCASDIVGSSVSALCFDSDAATLSKTVNSQIAIFTCSMATLAALRENGVQPDSCAGFSLGEYTALTASGMLSLEDGIRLVRRRGELMQQATDQADGCMAAVLGLADETVEQICAFVSGTVLPVNYNCEGQLVIAGERAAVTAAADACKQAGARRAVPLAVSGAFHTPLMADAADALREFAQGMTFHAPRIPLYTNVTGEILDASDMPEHLARHMTSPVRWKELVRTMLADGHSTALEIGPGRTLTGFAKRISKQLHCSPVETMEQVLAVAGQTR